MSVSVISLLAQASFQIAIATSQTFERLLPECSLARNLSEEFGLIGFASIQIMDTVRILVPDISLFIVCVLAYYICRKAHKINVKIERSQIYGCSENTKDTTFTDNVVTHLDPSINGEILDSADVPCTSKSEPAGVRIDDSSGPETFLDKVKFESGSTSL
jgi:hypothetical protein